MNSWKDHANLFTNGKFQCKVDYKDLNDSYKVTGINEEFFHIELEPVKSYNDLHFVEISKCTLIARPISDMSDEEICNLTGNKYTEQVCEAIRESLIRESNESDIRRSQYLYLLSLGIYPENQNHNDIIWRYENTNS